MPLRSVIQIDVDDEAFQAFRVLFDKYSEALDKMPSQWGKANQVQNKQRSTFSDILNSILLQVEALGKGSRKIDEIDHRLTRTQRTMQGLSRATREFSGNLSTATTTLMRWMGITGVVGALTGLLSAEGIGRLASSGAQMYRNTLSYAGPTTPAQVGASGAYAGILNTRSALSQLTEMLTTAEGKRGLIALGFGPQSWQRGAGAILPEFLQRLQRFSKQAPEGNLGDILSGFGLGGFSEQARILRRMTPEQLIQLTNMRLRNERELNKLTEQQLFNWTKLNSKIELAGTKIQSGFIIALDRLNPTIERIVDAFSKAVTNFLQSETVAKWLTQLEQALEKLDIEKFAQGLENGATKLVDFVGSVTKAITGLANFIAWIDKKTGLSEDTYGASVGKGALIGGVGGAWLGAKVGGLLAPFTGGASLPLGIALGAGIGAATGAVVGGQGYVQGNATEVDEKGNRVFTAPIPPAPKQQTSPQSSNQSNFQRQSSAAEGRWYTGTAIGPVAEKTGFNFGGIRAREGGFRTYPNAYAGVADMGDLLKSEYFGKGFDTLASIIQKWAPTDENNTQMLIQRASKWTGLSPNQKIDPNDTDTMRKIMIAMNRNEMGGNQTIDTDALDLYLSGKGPERPGAYGVPGATMNLGNQGELGRPGSNITKVSTQGGHSFFVNSAAADSFKGFTEELEKRGYKIDSIGGYNYREKRGGEGLSEHAFGNAIDINPDKNPFKSDKTDLPPDVHDLAAKWGLIWGGDWKSPRDPMHFQWGGSKPWLKQQEVDERQKRNTEDEWKAVSARSNSSILMKSQQLQQAIPNYPAYQSPQSVSVQKPSGIRVRVENDVGSSAVAAGALVAQ